MVLRVLFDKGVLKSLELMGVQAFFVYFVSRSL
jgi:hypothetical protein